MFFLIISCLLYAVNNFVWKKVLSVSNSWLLIISRSFLTSVIGVFICFFFFSEVLVELQLKAFGYVVAASFFGALGLLFMVLALKKGSLFQLGIFNLLIVFLTATYLFIFEDIDLENFSLAVILIGTGFMCYCFHIQKSNTVEVSKKQLLLFFGMALFFAASCLLHWYNLKQSFPVIVAVTVQELMVFILVGLLLLLKQDLLPKTIGIQLKSLAPFVLLMAIIIFISLWTGFIGLESTNPLISQLISLITPIFTILLGVFFNKDKCSPLALVASILIISGVFLLNFRGLIFF